MYNTKFLPQSIFSFIYVCPVSPTCQNYGFPITPTGIEIDLYIELNSLEVIPRNDPIYQGRIFHRPGEKLTPEPNESLPPVATALIFVLPCLFYSGIVLHSQTTGSSLNSAPYGGC